MNKNSDCKKPDKALYDRAVSGDCVAILSMGHFYHDREQLYKALEWYRYGGCKGHLKCMLYAAITAVSIADSTEFPNNKNTSLRLDMYTEARFWLEKAYEEYDEYVGSIKERENIKTHLDDFDRKLGLYYYEAVVENKNFGQSKVPKA